MFVGNLIHKNNSVVAAWSNIRVDNVWRAVLSVYFRNEGVSLQKRPSANSQLTSKKREIFLPSLKTSLLTVRESKPLLWCRQLE